MQLPIVAAAPIVKTHAPAFRHLFNDVRQYENFQHYLTGLIVLENKSLSNISRCILDSADKSNLSRFMSESPWDTQAVNRFRIQYMLSETLGIRAATQDSFLILDDTLCEHVGSLFEYVERHYDHCDGSYPLAHNLVTSYYLSGAVRFPVEAEVYRRYESVTKWAGFMGQHFPAVTIPNKAKDRAKIHKVWDAQLLELDPEFKRLHEQFRTKIDIAKMLLSQSLEQKLPFKTVLMDSWYLSPDLVQWFLKYKIDWVSLIKRNRNLNTSSFQLNDGQGNPIALPPQIKVEDLVPLIPVTSFQEVKMASQTYWCFTLCVRLEGLGKVRLVINFSNPELTGTYAVLISNRTDHHPKQIIIQYLQRWPIETFYRDSKQLLGLDEYRTRSFSAIKAHWCLVFVAYSILHLDCLPKSSEQRKGKLPTAPNQSIGTACRQQAQALIEQLILFAHNCLQKGETAAQVFCRLFAKQNQQNIMTS